MSKIKNVILLVLVYLIKTELIIDNFIIFISKSSPVLPHGLPVNIVNKIQQLEEVRDCISSYSLYNPLLLLLLLLLVNIKGYSCY